MSIPSPCASGAAPPPPRRPPPPPRAPPPPPPPPHPHPPPRPPPRHDGRRPRQQPQRKPPWLDPHPPRTARGPGRFDVADSDGAAAAAKEHGGKGDERQRDEEREDPRVGEAEIHARRVTEPGRRRVAP